MLQDNAWVLRVGESLCELKNCPFLKECPAQFCCINDVLKVLSTLDGSKKCIGNDDEKFEKVAAVHKGVFKDKSGKLPCAVKPHHHCSVIVIDMQEQWSRTVNTVVFVTSQFVMSIVSCYW